ncbi:copper-binding protein [Rhodoferax ferrireducens]|uniref:copper-binding protein n=1 Tax=Rhodoferax ferrireducens TaxID=192843 RepID=UPI000E0D01C1|nr:copper-binding protein [Rhodoferax ferrireducens]
MKKITTTLIVAVTLSASVAFAQQKMDTMKPMDMAKKPATEAQMAQMTHKALGVVKKVDPKAGVVTLAHEAVNSMNWPPMTMGFKVKDKALLAKLKEGQKVAFEFVQEGDDYVVTQIK